MIETHPKGKGLQLDLDTGPAFDLDAAPLFDLDTGPADLNGKRPQEGLLKAGQAITQPRAETP